MKTTLIARRTLSFVVLGLFCRLPLHAQTQVQWTSGSGGNDHYYQLVLAPGGITWPAANTAAQAAGGYLATLTSAAENNFIYTNLASTNAAAWFIDGAGNSEGPILGGFQPIASDGSNGWNWVTGETWSYTNWETSEPSNQNSTEDSLVFFKDGTSIGNRWNDVDHTAAMKSYIIEFNTNPIPEPGASAALLGGLAVAAALWRRREPRRRAEPHL
jgi:hypothetical protein